MPLKIEQKKLFEFVKSMDDTMLITTARKKNFHVNALENDLAFTPMSSGKSRKEASKNIAKVIERYNDNKSLQPKDYHDITFNSVYLITLIEMYLKAES